MNKEDIELSSVRQLCLALKLNVDKEKIIISGEGNDPPDVEFECDEKLIGVECTRYCSNAHLGKLLSKEAKNSSFRLNKRMTSFCNRLLNNDSSTKVSHLEFALADSDVEVMPENMFDLVEKELFELINSRKAPYYFDDELNISNSEIRNTRHENLKKYISYVVLSKNTVNNWGQSKIIRMSVKGKLEPVICP